MPPSIGSEMLENARKVLGEFKNLFWIVGGAGSGKSTISKILSREYDLPICDMDDQIYGSFHGRFDAERHPVNTAWSSAENSLQWLLAKTWKGFDAFNRAALPEYLELLAEDVGGATLDRGLLVDGGICNPGLLARVIAADQIVCVAAEPDPSASIWDLDGPRSDMRAFVHQLDEPQKNWERFLEFDRNITRTIRSECAAAGIKIVVRGPSEPPLQTAQKVAGILKLGPQPAKMG